MSRNDRNLNEESDEFLVRQAIQDKNKGKGQIDTEAFNILLYRHRRIVELTVARYVLRDDIEDVLQEVYMNAWNGLEYLNKPQNFGSWLGRIAKNRAIDYFRQRMRQNKLMPSNSLDETPPDELSIYGAETGIEAREYIERVLGALQKKLPEKQYWCYVLKTYGYSPEKIAERLSIKEDSVNAYCSTANTKVKEIRKSIRQEQERGLL